MHTRREELGAFLQAMRARCVPESFGFAAGSRRRTSGLRREEVAQLAGISPTWYTWIEQGREVRVSPEVLDRLAQSLRLSASERAYLFDMAGRHDPHEEAQEDDSASSAIAALLPDIAIPAYLMGRYWDLLAWNAPAAGLFAGWLDQPRSADAALPNMLRFVFLDPRARNFVVDWETRARRITAEFRADCRSRFEEPGLQRLVDALTRESPEFARYWKQHDVLERQGGQRAFNHPRYGLLTCTQVTLRPVEHEPLKLVLLQPLASAPAKAGRRRVKR